MAWEITRRSLLAVAATTQASAGEVAAPGVVLLHADPARAVPSLDSAGYLQGLLDRAHTTALRKVGARCTVVISSRFYGSEMLIVPDLVDVEMSDDGAYDVSRADMISGFLVNQTVGTRMKNVRVIGSGQGRQPVNKIEMRAADVRESGCGIIYAGVRGGLIENCRVENCGGVTGRAPYNGVAGIWLTRGARDCVVRGNQVQRCRNGINEDNFFHISPSGNEIYQNTVSDCRFGIALDSDASAKDTTVARNVVIRCLQSGIDLNKARNARVTQNRVESCGLENGNSGIWLYGSTSIRAESVLIEGNTISNSGGYGIKVGSNVLRVEIVGNRCVGNKRNGIAIIGHCELWTIFENELIGNGLEGVRFDASNFP